MIVSINNSNCDFENAYLIKELADSTIELRLEFERIVSSQSKKVTRDSFKTCIVNEMKKYKWLILGKVHIGIHWFLDALDKQETDKIGNLDNITKPMLDMLSGTCSVMIDDSQINSIQTSWSSKKALQLGTIMILLISFNNDYTITKANLFFLQTNPLNYTPVNLDPNSKTDLIEVKHFIESFKMKREVAEDFKSKLVADTDRYLVYSECEFHRTRLGGFAKHQILKNSELVEIFNRHGICA